MRKAPIFLILALTLLLAAFHLATPLSPLLDLRAQDPSLAALLLTEIRLPRLLLAAGYGAVLGMTGAALQALFANPLASPDITGSSSGAALGAVIGGYFFGATGPLVLAMFGAGGAAVALVALLLLAGRRSDTATLLLAGLAITLAAGAATSLALALAPSPFAFYDSFDWLMGSFVDRSLPQAAAALVPAGLACALLVRHVKALDMMALGEDVAASTGYRPRRIGTEIIVLSAIAVGACVSVCGAIGFVGLIAPFVARQIMRGHPGRALPWAALVGSALMLAADLGVRLAPAGRAIPVGVLTTVVGTPLFIWIVVSMRRRLAA
ncbi:MAG TPA: iron ABC transporter permease [Sphingomicrobium sp.]|nr:iron ABC transporter permease [Sphingomicrobium sp.]